MEVLLIDNIAKLNSVLKKEFGIDILNPDIKKGNCLAKEIYEKTKRYFEVSMSLEELIKKIYGSDVEIISKDEIKESHPSCFKDLITNCKNREDLILSLDDLGYDLVTHDYFLKSGDKTKRIGTYATDVKKYWHSYSYAEYMVVIEKLLNVQLQPLAHFTWLSETVYINQLTGKKYDSKNSTTIENEVRTTNNEIVCKEIQVKNYNGYSHNLDLGQIQVNGDIRNGELSDLLKNISEEVLQDIKKYILSENEEVIIALIIECVGNHITENMKENNQTFFIQELLNKYAHMQELCKINLIDVPQLDCKSFTLFVNSLIQNLDEQMKKSKEKIKSIQDSINKTTGSKEEIKSRLNELIDSCLELYGVIYENNFNHVFVSTSESLIDSLQRLHNDTNLESLNDYKLLVISLKEELHQVLSEIEKGNYTDEYYHELDDNHIAIRSVEALLELLSSNLSFIETACTDIHDYEHNTQSQEEEIQSIIDLETQMKDLILFAKDILVDLNQYEKKEKESKTQNLKYQRVLLSLIALSKKIKLEDVYELVELQESYDKSSLLKERVSIKENKLSN